MLNLPELNDTEIFILRFCIIAFAICVLVAFISFLF